MTAHVELEVVLKALAPAVLVEELLKMLRDAFHSVGVVSGDPYGPAKGIRRALEITDALLAEVHEERKRHVGRLCGIPQGVRQWLNQPRRHGHGHPH
jgi:phosphoserine phosphatase